MLAPFLTDDEFGRVLPNVEVPKRAKQGHLGGDTFALQPFNLGETQIPSLPLC